MTDIAQRLRGWSPHDDEYPRALIDEAAEEIRQLRAKVAAIEAMGYEWRWTRSIDENGEQVGAWVMRHDAAEIRQLRAELAAMLQGGGA